MLSRRSPKQRREEDRFRTRTITKEDLQTDDRRLEEEANRVATAIEEKRCEARSRSASADMLKQEASAAASSCSSRDERRSASIEVLDEKEMTLTMEIPICSSSSAENSPRKGPKICKPGSLAAPPERSPPPSSSEEVGKGVRGRRRPLYSVHPPTTTTKRATPPAGKPVVAPKPSIAPKPRYVSSLSSPGRVGSPPTQIRGTRASNLRQSSNRHNSPPPPSSPGRMSSPRGSGLNNSGYSSAGSSTCSSRASSSRYCSSSRQSSATSTRASNKPPLVRQGTFTKDDSSSNLSSEETHRNKSSSSPKSIRRDSVHPAGMQRPVVTSKPPPSYTRPLQRPSQQQKPPASTLQPAKFGQPRTNFYYSRERLAPPRASQGGGNLRKNNPSTSSNGSLASLRSAKSSGIPLPRSSAESSSSHSAATASGISASKSSHNLRTPNDSLASPQSSLGRRAPSSSSIEHSCSTRAQQSRSSLVGQRAPGSSGIIHPRSRNLSGASADAISQGDKKPPTPKKEVTSKIANLWKKVEDSKKSKDKKDNNDPRVWIAQGKVIPENELALLKPHAEQQEIISNFRQTSSASSSDLKPKSRLSLRLSKFSKAGKQDKSVTSPVPTQIEDSLNGNVIVAAAADASADDNEAKILRQFRASLSSPAGEQQATAAEDRDRVPDLAADIGGAAKRHSRLGSFFNPGESGATSTPAENNPGAIRFHSPNRSQASAIVPPFNYSPPIKKGEEEERGGGLKSPSSAQVRRNDSYVSSMGRKPNVDRRPEEVAKAKAEDKTKKTASSSAMVTLV